MTTFSVDDAGFLPRVAEEMLAVATGAGLLEHQALAHLILVSGAVGAADTTAAAAHLRAATQVATTGQLPALALVASTFEATTELLAGRLGAARTAHDRLADRIVASGDPNGEIIRMWVLASVEAAGGDTSRLLPELEALHRRVPGGVDDLLVGARLDAGDVAGARALWPLPVRPRDGTWLYATALLADNAVRLGDAAEARRAHGLLLPWAGQLARTLNGALVLGPVDHFLGVTAQLLGDGAAAARHHDRAERLAGRLGAAHWVERTRRARG